VVVLERPKPPKDVKAKPALAIPISPAVPTGETSGDKQSSDDGKEIEMTETTKKKEEEKGGAAASGGEGAAKTTEESEAGKEEEKKSEEPSSEAASAGEGGEPSKKKEDEKQMAGPGGLFDVNNDGEFSAAELEAAAKGVPRGRKGVVTKFMDGQGRYIIEFDDENAEKDDDDDEENEEEEEEESSSESDVDSEDEDNGFYACIVNGCQKPLTKRQKRSLERRERKKVCGSFFFFFFFCTCSC
jgi:hypothetical protein